MKIHIIETQDGIDLDVVKLRHLKLSKLSSIAKELNKDSAPHEIEWLRKEISTLRQEIKNFCTMVFKVTVDNGSYFYHESYKVYPTKDELAGLKKAFIEQVKSERKKLLQINTEHKELLGFKYDTVGGSFMEPGAINKLAATVNNKERIRINKVPSAKMKSNYVGVELEFICKVDSEELNILLIYAGLTGYVKVTTDGSIQGKGPGEYAHEIRVLAKEGDILRIIKLLCDVLNSNTVGGHINNTCGLHVHLDARNRSPDYMYNNLVMALPMLSAMVPSDRINNRYCALNTTHIFKDATRVFDKDHTSGGDPRYQAINPESYAKHKTLEVRLHSGSLNNNKIGNWVSILMMLVNSETSILKPIKNGDEFKEMFPSTKEKMVSYINKRILLFSTKKIKDTKEDHFNSTQYELVV